MTPTIEPGFEPCIARLETHWHAPWLIGALSHLGAAHYAEGMPNQDAFAIGRAGRASWLTLADGVSTKPMSQAGATIATRAAGAYLAKMLSTQPPSARMLGFAFEAARKALTVRAIHQRRPVTDYACTLLIGVLSHKTITVGKVGDGSIVALERYREGCNLVSLVNSPHVGEGVVDLTHSAWKTNLRVRHLSDRPGRRIETVAMATDGANPYLFKTVDAHDEKKRRGEFNPSLIGDELARQLDARSPRNFAGYLGALMFSNPYINEPDDKTLIVATIPSKATPCFPTTA